MKFRFGWLPLCLLLGFSLLLASCGCDDDDDDDDDAGAADDDDATDDDAPDDDAADDDDNDDAADDDDDSSPTELFDLNFDDYAAGDLPSSWTIETHGAGYFAVVADPTKKDGNVVGCQGDPALGAWTMATYPFSSALKYVEVSYDVYHEAGGASMMSVNGPEDFVAEVYRDQANGQTLKAWSGELGETPCETLVDVTWYRITLVLDLNAQTYSVLVDGAATYCNDVAMYEASAGYLTGFSLMDAAEENYGGSAYYDNIRGVEY